MSLSFWLKASRPWSFPASAMPVILTAAFLFYVQRINHLHVNWWLLPIILFAVICYHAAMNMISDYFDFKTGVDHKDSLGDKSPLVTNEINGKRWMIHAFAILSVGTAAGVFTVFFSGLHVLWIGAIGLICGYFYNKFKKIALGDALIFVIFGVLIVQGTWYVLTSELSATAVLLSIPIALLTTAILHANNTRDIAFDTKVGFHSQAALLGFNGARWRYAILIFGAYLASILMTIFGMLPYHSLLIFITLPLAIKNVKTIFKSSPDNLEPMLSLDAATAQLQMFFALAFTFGTVFAGIMV